MLGDKYRRDCLEKKVNKIDARAKIISRNAHQMFDKIYGDDEIANKLVRFFGKFNSQSTNVQ